MTLPHLHCLCVSYARPQLVESVISAFLGQEYEGPHSLHVENTFPDQFLTLESTPAKPVTIFNALCRPKNLGEARNKAIGDAPENSIQVVFDDDDGYASHHLSTLAKHFTDGIDWVWLDKIFWSAQGQIKGIALGSPNVFAFTKRAWKEVGGYPALSCGEDRALISKITAKFKGVRVHLRPEEISFVYGWDNGLPHLSGHGFDKPGSVSGYEKVRLQVEAGVKARKIPTGEIVLRPKLLHDYAAQAKEYLARTMNQNPAGEDVCVLQLGRYGDIVNILPVALAIHNSYKKPHFMVAKEFASILDGVSYVTPFVFDGGNDQLKEAVAIAKAKFKYVIVTQIWGRNWHQERRCQTYNIESWHEAGFAHKFNDPTWRPVFDQDLERGQAVKERALAGWDGKQPVFLYNLTKAHTAPFAAGDKVLAELRSSFKSSFFVDASQLKLERIYDLLPLIEAADMVISIDTALLHLTGATQTPILALINPTPWVGSVPRIPNCKPIRYDYAAADPSLVCIEINNLGFSGGRFQENNIRKPSAPPQRFLLHAVERHEEANLRERERKQSAWATWDELYASHGVIPCHLWNYPRTALDIGDSRPLPYLKDVLSFAMQQAGDDDIIFFTNDDNMLHPDLPSFLKFHVSVYGALAMRRCEFQRPPPPLTSREHWVGMHTSHCGRDLFAFQCSWLKERFDSIPDFILGAPEWDFGITCLIRQSFGITSDSRNIFDLVWPAEIGPSYVGHVMHQSVWAKPNVNTSSPANKHNRRLFSEWARKTGEGILFSKDNTIAQEWDTK